MLKRLIRYTALVLPVSSLTVLGQEQSPSDAAIPEDLGGGLYLLQRPTGNLLVSTGDDGTFLVGSTIDDLGEELVAAVASITDVPISFPVEPYPLTQAVDENARLTGGLIVSDGNIWQRMEH